MKNWTLSQTKSESFKFREKHLKLGYELVDITHLCEFKLGNSGSCNSFNEPEENIYHIRCVYRDEIIANFTGNTIEVMDCKKHISFMYDENFIIFRKVKL